MSQNEPTILHKDRYLAWLTPGLLTIGLIFAVFAIPRPAMLSNQPWKSELVLLVALGAVILFGKAGLRTSVSGDARIIRLAIALFTLWGLASGLWAASFASAVHHTLVWTIYLIAFELVLRGNLTRTVVIRIAMLVGCLFFVTVVTDFAFITDFRAVEGLIRIRYGKYGEMLATITPFLFGVAVLSKNTRSMLVAVIVASATWIAAMLSLSKGVFISGVAGFTVFAVIALITCRRRRRRAATVILVFVLITVVTQAAFSLLTSIPATVDYISGKADATRGTSEFRIFTWQTSMYMVRDHWLVGVGADNFGIAFNEARAASHAARPTDRTLEQAEDYLVERAHNEPLQIASELGIVGIALFAAIFISFIALSVKALRRRQWTISPLFCGAVGGMAAFAVSSMVSSFSLRAVQNGCVFFLLMGVAAATVVKRKRVRARPTFPIIVPLVVFVVAAAFLVPKGIAEYLAFRSERIEDPAAAIRDLVLAAKLDPDYAGASLLAAGRADASGDTVEAARHMNAAIQNGIGVTTTYMLLAGFHEKNGDIAAADASYQEASRLFVNSIFVRVVYQNFLEKQGRVAEAETQKHRAAEIDPRQARGWYELITKGSTNAFYDAQQDPSIAEPKELKPESAVQQYINK